MVQEVTDDLAIFLSHELDVFLGLALAVVLWVIVPGLGKREESESGS